MFILIDKEEQDLKINKIRKQNKINFLHNQIYHIRSTLLNHRLNRNNKELIKEENNN